MLSTYAFFDVFLFSVFAFLVGYSDFKERRIPDVFNAGMWMGFLGIASEVPYIAVLAVAVFSWAFFLNAAWVMFKKPEPPLSWGDILGAPPIVGMIGLFSWSNPFLAMPLAGAVLAMLIAPYFSKDKGQPMMAYVAVGYFASLALWLILLLQTA